MDTQLMRALCLIGIAALASEIDQENISAKSARKQKPLKIPRSSLVLAHEDRIEKRTDDLAKKLEAAREAWEAEFWKRSKLKNKAAIVEKADSAAISAAEAASIKEIVSELSGDAWSQALYDELTLIAEAGYVSAGDILQAAGMELHIDFNTIPAVTLAEIRKQAEQFAFMVNQREQQALFDVIDTAVAEGQTPGTLAKIIGDTFSEGYHVTDESGVVKRYPTDSWSRMVARTELSRAQTMGNIALYQAAEIQRVMWATSQGENVCPECEERDGEVYDLENVDAPPLHPNCACALMPADEDVAYRSPEAA